MISDRKSSCCGSHVSVQEADGGTSCYVCCSCQKACDLAEPIRCTCGDSKSFDGVVHRNNGLPCYLAQGGVFKEGKELPVTTFTYPEDHAKEILTEFLERVCPKGGTPLDRGHAIVELAQYLLELYPNKS